MMLDHLLRRTLQEVRIREIQRARTTNNNKKGGRGNYNKGKQGPKDNQAKDEETTESTTDAPDNQEGKSRGQNHGKNNSNKGKKEETKKERMPTTRIVRTSTKEWVRY